ncbi:MAG: NnrS family protein, partial [Leptospiraceae bacterium]|nr:NnrS family protein [Leptospiraceae bacterium]
MKISEPYKIFFPLSLIGLFYSIFLWVFSFLEYKGIMKSSPFGIYPLQYHIYTILGLYILPAFAGFILTAIPRFTGTK